MRTELRTFFLAAAALGSLALLGCGGGDDSPSSADETPQSRSESALAAAPATQAFEAESATRGGGANIQSASNASGGLVVGHLSVAGAYMQLRVEGGVGGTFSLTMRFSNAHGFTSRLGLYVNGVRQTANFAFTGGWNNFIQLTVPVKLVAGTNVIRLQHDASDPGGVHIDRVVFSAPPAGSAVLSWGAVADSRVTGYRIYYGTASRTYLQSAGRGLATGKNTTYTVTNLQSGRKYYFAVTAVDTTGKESLYSNEATKTVP